MTVKPTDIFSNRKTHPSSGKTQIPVWFMRQAGRYHQHYQKLKQKHTFMELCKNSELAAEVTLGPIEEFHFDAAILFSDLLFPLEQLGLGLDYDSGPPKIHRHLLSYGDCKYLHAIATSQNFYAFQANALKILRKKLPVSCTLLGFVGSPWTLFSYAAEGSHSGNLISSKNGLRDKRWDYFCEKLLPHLIENMIIQAESGADAVCVFDTAAGELSFHDFNRFVAPKLNFIFSEFKTRLPNKKIIYYSKWTNYAYFEKINFNLIDVVGVDWRIDLADFISQLPDHVYVQGNIDPGWLHLPWTDLEKNLEIYFSHLKNHNFPFKRWIAGLGHGVLIQTPEVNVKNTVKYIHENWGY